MAGRRASKISRGPPPPEFVSEAPSDVPSSYRSSRARSPRGFQPAAFAQEEEEDERPRRKVPCWVDPDEALVEWLYHHRMYNISDPFRDLNGMWLRTGEKGLEDDEIGEEEEEEEEEEDEEDEEAAARRAEKERKRAEAQLRAENVRRQLRACRGHMVWMRGRDLRAELVDQTERRADAAQSSTATPPAASTRPANSRRNPTGSRDSEGLVWWVAPRVAKGAKEAGVAESGPRKTWCWRSDFVTEVLYTAEAMAMEHPVVDAAEARSAVRRDPDLAVALRHHVAVLSTDRQCKLWSPNFLQSLDVLRLQWKQGEEVRLEEEQLMASLPEARALLAKDKPAEQPIDWTRMRVPSALLEARREPPPLVVPDRLPKRVPYKSDEFGFGRVGSLTLLPYQSEGSKRSMSSAPGFQSAGRLAMPRTASTGGRHRSERSATGASARTSGSSRKAPFARELV